MPGEGRYKFVATRDQAGSYAMVYVPVARKFTLRLEALTGATVRAWWFNPRDGTAIPAGEFRRTATREFAAPNRDDDLDWILVVDDASKQYPAPGTALGTR